MISLLVANETEKSLNFYIKIKGQRDKIFIPSNIEHVKFCMNLREPSRKAKYSWITDSELVPRGKGEIEFRKKSEIDREITSLKTEEK